MSKATASNDIQAVIHGYPGNEKVVEFETILVESSSSEIYSELLKHEPNNNEEMRFLRSLKDVIKTGVKSFRVPVCDPSISKFGFIQFIPGCKPATGIYYYGQHSLAAKNCLRLGTKSQYILFLATIIYRLKKEGWSEEKAFYAVCKDSKELGHYCDSKDKITEGFEQTGSRKIAGKYDLANTCKILADDDNNEHFWIASGCCKDFGCKSPLATITFFACLYEDAYCNCVGWYVV